MKTREITGPGDTRLTLFGYPVTFADAPLPGPPPVFGPPVVDLKRGDCGVCGRPDAQIMAIYRGREKIGEACGPCAEKIVHGMRGL